MKRLIPILAVVALTCGCSSLKITPQVLQSGATALTKAGIERYPESLPYIEAFSESICVTAGSTNLAPTNVVAQINVPTAGTPSAQGALIARGVVALYTAIYLSYGNHALDNLPKLRLYLQAICDGTTDALPDRITMESAKTPRQRNWPMNRVP